MKILYFGSFNPDYARNRVLLKGLRLNGIEVEECNDRSGSMIKYWRLFWKYLKLKSGFDIMIVGFPGQEMMFLAKLLTLRLYSGQARKPIIFDAFTSHYEGYILDRQYFGKKSLRAKYYRFVDKYSCRLADMILLDTQAHIDFFVKEYSLPVSKFQRIFVGTDTDVFYPSNLNSNQGRQFTVHFHGSYVPLQGVSHIIKAAKILENEGIKFNLIGQGQTYNHDRKLVDGLNIKNINFIDNVAYNKLPEFMNQADIALGIFGDSPKTRRVIPNKIYEALAMRKPVVTADTPAIKELLTDREDVLLCRSADPEDLAAKILELKNNENLRNKIAENGYTIFKSNADEKILGLQIKNILLNCERTALSK